MEAHDRMIDLHVKIRNVSKQALLVSYSRRIGILMFEEG
jgi:hypothetical protein